MHSPVILLNISIITPMKIKMFANQKQTKIPTVKVVLTSPNNKYQKNIENMFNGCLTLPQ